MRDCAIDSWGWVHDQGVSAVAAVVVAALFVVMSKMQAWRAEVDVRWKRKVSPLIACPE